MEKVEAEVLTNFGDTIYGKQRVAGDKFICDKELAIKRANLIINGKEKPLLKILRVVPDDTPEEPKVENKELKNFLNQTLKKEEISKKQGNGSIFPKKLNALKSKYEPRFSAKNSEK